MTMRLPKITAMALIFLLVLLTYASGQGVDAPSPTMQENLMTILTFAAGILSIVIVTYGQIIAARVQRWSDAKLQENGLTQSAKWQADLKAGLLTGAKAALLDGKSITEAIRLAIAHTLASNAEAAAGLRPSEAVLDRLAKAAVTDAATQMAAAAANAVKAGPAAGPALDELTTVLHHALNGHAR